MSRRIVLVRWVDSASLFHEQRWTDEQELDEHMAETYCETVGFLIRENNHSLYVAGSVTSEEIGSVTQIPKCAVVTRRELAAA